MVSVYVLDGVDVFGCDPVFNQTNEAFVTDADTSRSERLPPSQCMITIRPIVSEIGGQSDREPLVVVGFGDSIPCRCSVHWHCPDSTETFHRC